MTTVPTEFDVTWVAVVVVAVTPILSCLDAAVGRGGTLDVPMRGISLIASSPENDTLVVLVAFALVVVALDSLPAAVDG